MQSVPFVKYIAHSFSCLLLLAACKRNDSVPCRQVAATASMRFRIFDAFTGTDLLITGGLNRDSLKGWQPCHADSLYTSFASYQIPGSASHGYTFIFPNLRNPAVTESDPCFTIYLRWSSHDVDTITWHYHIEQDGDCSLQIMDGVQYNGIQANKADDGAYTYYALIK